jgi:hypothetical protein
MAITCFLAIELNISLYAKNECGFISIIVRDVGKSYEIQTLFTRVKYISNPSTFH